MAGEVEESDDLASPTSLRPGGGGREKKSGGRRRGLGNSGEMDRRGHVGPAEMWEERVPDDARFRRRVAPVSSRMMEPDGGGSGTQSGGRRRGRGSSGDVDRRGQVGPAEMWEERGREEAVLGRRRDDCLACGMPGGRDGGKTRLWRRVEERRREWRGNWEMNRRYRRMRGARK